MITALPRIAIAMPAAEYDDAVECFRSVFGMPVDDYSSWTVPDLGAHVGMCQPAPGSNVELMAPSDPEAPLSQALQRFLDRRGTGIYALMLEAPSPDDEAERLSMRGMNVLPLMAGAGGRDVHPNSTHGVLIRVYPDGSVEQPIDPISESPHLSGIVRAIVAVDDAAAAAKTWGFGLGLQATEAAPDAERGVLVATAQAPTGATVELVSPADSSRPFGAEIERRLMERGQGIAALVLEAEDPVAATVTLGGRGLPHEVDGPFGPQVDAFGVSFVLSSPRSL